MNNIIIKQRLDVFAEEKPDAFAKLVNEKLWEDATVADLMREETYNDFCDDDFLADLVTLDVITSAEKDEYVQKAAQDKQRLEAAIGEAAKSLNEARQLAEELGVPIAVDRFNYSPRSMYEDSLSVHSGYWMSSSDQC